ncbi:hypothetical protein [Thiomicrorhabdus sp. Kp2]|nr:hypothetical protein [Thiomicrorhabdus sp. Kp2]
MKSRTLCMSARYSSFGKAYAIIDVVRIKTNFNQSRLNVQAKTLVD